MGQPPPTPPMGPDDRDRQQSKQASIGKLGIAIILGGSVLAICVLGFLLFLWIAEGPAGGASAPRLWRWIVVHNYLAQVITLCSALLHIILVLQTLLGTSLIAAVLLEGPGYSVPLSKAAELSVTRSVNSGPFGLAYIMFSTTWFIRKAKMPVLLTSALLILTIASQFMSTLLVADLKTSALIGFEQPMRVFVDKLPTNHAPIMTYDYLGVPPTFIPYGEFTSPADTTPTSLGLSDTGPVRRVFLPLEEGNRTTVRAYQGQAYVYTSRYACVPPAVQSATLLKFPLPGVTTGAYTNSFVGNISYPSTFANAGVDFKCPGTGCFTNQSIFSCSLSFIDGNNVNKPLTGRHPAFSVCALDRSNFIFKTPLNDFSNIIGDQPVQEYSAVFLAFKTNITEQTVASTLTPQNNITFPLNYKRQDEFITWDFDQIQLSMSVCFQTFIIDTAVVDMSADRDLTPPEGRWDFSRNTWDTSNLLPFFGVTNKSTNASDRGLYQVDNVKNFTRTFLWSSQGSGDLTSLSPGSLSYNTIMNFSPDQIGRADVLVNDATGSIITDIMNTTGRPVHALQTLGTIGAMNALALPRPKLDQAADVSVVHSTFVPAPRNWRGLLAVTIIIFGSLACANAIMVLFLLWTKHAVRGDYWHAVAQMVSEDMRWILAESTDKQDSAVSRMLGSQGEARVRIKRSYSEQEGKSIARLVIVRDPDR